MTDLLPVICAVTLYIGLLFVLAVAAERRVARGKNVAANAVVYALAQAVYCTTWTYYGSVGFAVTSGLLFLTVYLGPTLAIAFSGSLLRKLIRIKARHNITSIADFVSARYGKSQAVGALATGMIVFGLVPYLSLQLKAMTATVDLMTRPGATTSYPGSGWYIGPVMVVLMIVFTIVFGIRRLRPTERHPGMMVALVAECVVKLVAFLAAGIFVVYVLFDGFQDLLGRAAQLPTLYARHGRGVSPPPSTWFSHLLLSASAILFLPRQFHVAVVENSSEKHLRTSQWLLPLYLLAICLFALPIAVAGVSLGMRPEAGDTFVLALPVAAGHRWLSWLVFLGGFSAGTGMVMVETMTIATMVSNHLFLPVVDQVRPLAFLRGHIRTFRWVAAAGIIVAAFAYERAFGWQYEIVRTGMISFAAALQFAPAILVGLYWKNASRVGALLGLSGGFMVWGYTLILPLLARQGLVPISLLHDGPFGVGWLRPEALFGIGAFDNLTHATFWSLIFNCGLLLFGSLLFAPSATDTRTAEWFVDALSPQAALYAEARRPALISVADKRPAVERLLAAYFGEAAATRIADETIAATGADPAGRLSILQLAQLEAEVERALAASIGAAAAHTAIKRSDIITAEESGELSMAYAEILADLRIPPSDLRGKVDYHQERARLLAKEAETLRALADANRRLASSLEYETTARTAARIPVPWLVPASLLYLSEEVPGSPPLHFIFACEDPERERRVGDRLAGLVIDPRAIPALDRALRSGRPEIVAPDRSTRWPGPFAEVGFELSLTLPLLARRNPLGTLTFFSHENGRFRYPDDLALAQEVAYRCAAALDNAALFHRTQEAVRARDEFLAVASHELKTPITPLRLHVQSLHRLLARGDLASVPSSHLDQILTRSEAQLGRLSKLVDSLLDVSRITRGRIRLAIEPVDIAEMATEVAALLREQLSDAGCLLVLEIAPRIVGRWDRLRIEQVLTNLLTNAIKYAPGSPVEVRVSSSQGRAAITVRDHGPGISGEDKERIFRPFERAVSYLEVSGFGLGLYIARQIVEAHGGTISLESKLGQGCLFTVELPLEPRGVAIADANEGEVVRPAGLAWSGAR